MNEFKKYISTNFILLSAETTVGKVFSKINHVNPEFVIIYRVDQNTTHKKLLYYTFLSDLLLDFKRQFPDRGESNNTLLDFLALHEYDADKTFEISGKIPAANDPTIDELFQNNKDNSELIPLSHGNSIVGIFDSRRQKEESLYTIKAFNHSTKRRSLSPDPEPKSEPAPEPKRRLRSIRRLIPRRRSPPPAAMAPPPNPPRSNGEDIIESDETKNLSKVGKFVSTKMRQKMKIGNEESIFIELKAKKPPEEELPTGNNVIDISYPPGVSEIELVVTAMSTNPEVADIQDPQPKKMIVPIEGNSTRVEFKIIPKKEGPFSITTVILYQSNPLGLFQTHSKVGNEVSDSLSSSNGVVNPNTTNPGPDLTMIIKTITKKPFLFEIDIFAPNLGIRYDEYKHTEDCGNNTEEFFRATFQSIERINPYRNSYEQNTKKMSSIGIDLYNRLFPEAFKEFYWKNKDKISTIHVISSEPWIPWEIIKPWREENDEIETGKFLCEEHTMTRWLSGIDIVQKPTIKSIKVVQPKDTDLQGAKVEAKFLADFWKDKLNSKDNFSKDSSLDDVTTSLEEGDFDIMHFTTHGSYNQDLATQSEILLENNQVLTPIDLNGTEINIKKNNPIVILNACQTGNQGFVLTGIGGWSEAFLKKYASVFMGTLWSVSDNTALIFTESLYQHLKDNKPLDEAVKQARIKAKNDTNGDPSWLAYSLYAQPNTKFELVVGDD